MNYFDKLAEPKPINHNFDSRSVKDKTNDRLRVDLRHAIALADKRLKEVEQLQELLVKKLSREAELAKIIKAINQLEAVVKSLILEDSQKKGDDALKQGSFTSIAESIAEYCCVTLDEMKGVSRERRYVRARSIFYAITNRVYSSVEIGKFLNRDHSTVLHALNNLSKTLNKFDFEFINYYNGKSI